MHRLRDRDRLGREVHEYREDQGHQQGLFGSREAGESPVREVLLRQDESLYDQERREVLLQTLVDQEGADKVNGYDFGPDENRAGNEKNI